MIKIGTRKSKLALWQAYKVQAHLEDLEVKNELVLIESEGDKVLDTPLPLMGGKGVFTKALDDALLAGHIDIAVHSLKDVPTRLPEGIITASILERANPFDVLVVRDNTSFVNEEDYAAVIATSSNRRRSQWLYKYPKHSTTDIRGNVQTRIKKLRESDWDAAIFAAAGLERMELHHEIAMTLDWMLPAPGQGAVAVVARKDDTDIFDIMQKFNHPETEMMTRLERDFLNELNGGCSAPIGAHAILKNNHVYLHTLLMDPNAEQRIELKLDAPLSEAGLLGRQAAHKALELGAKEIIDALPQEKRLH